MDRILCSVAVETNETNEIKRVAIVPLDDDFEMSCWETFIQIFDETIPQSYLAESLQEWMTRNTVTLIFPLGYGYRTRTKLLLEKALGASTYSRIFSDHSRDLIDLANICADVCTIQGIPPVVPHNADFKSVFDMLKAATMFNHVSDEIEFEAMAVSVCYGNLMYKLRIINNQADWPIVKPEEDMNW